MNSQDLINLLGEVLEELRQCAELRICYEPKDLARVHKTSELYHKVEAAKTEEEQCWLSEKAFEEAFLAKFPHDDSPWAQEEGKK